MLKKSLLLLPFMVLFVITSSYGMNPSPNFNVAGFEKFASTDSVIIYDAVDEMPEIEGGFQEVYKHIKYPKAAISRRVEGRVFIKFIVDENGKVKEPEIVKDIGAGCGDAAIEAIQKVKFIPGKMAGKAVNVYFTLPVTFQIQN